MLLGTCVLIIHWTFNPDNCLNERKNFCWALVSHNCHFPSQVPPAHKGWSWSLRGHRSSWQIGNMFRTFFSMVGTTFAKHLYLIIVIFPLKMPHVHEVWSWSLRGHRSSWQLGNMIRTTVSMVGTTFAKHLNLIIVIFLLKMSQVHEVWSWSLRGHKPSWQLGNMFRTTVSMVGTSHNGPFPCRNAHCPWSLEFESKRTRCPLFMKFGVGPGLENLPNGNCELQSWDTFELWATRIGLKIFIYRDIISEIWYNGWLWIHWKLFEWEGETGLTILILQILWEILPKIGSKHVKGSKLGEGYLGGLKTEKNLVTARAALGKNRNYWLL